MKRPVAHQIDESARAILHSQLPKVWVINEQRNDYAKDYLVELADADGRLTGESFYVQLKGTDHVSYSKDKKFVTFTLKHKHATYYADQVRDLPVFLVLCDTTATRAWWVHLQPILMSSGSWRSRRSLTIRLPVGNRLDCTSELRDAVVSSKRWMRANNPSSIQDAVAHESNRLIAIDPRFAPTLSIIDGHQYWRLEPTTDVELHLRTLNTSAAVRKKFSDVFENGEQVEFNAGEIEIIGTPLFAHAKNGITLQASMQVTGEATLIAYDGVGNEIGRLNNVPGKLTGGPKRLQYQGSLSNLFSMSVGPIGSGVGGSITFSLNHELWEGKSLKDLQYFRRLVGLFSCLNSAKALRVECSANGQTVLNAKLRVPRITKLSMLAELFGLIAEAQAICNELNINPRWTLNEDTWLQIKDVYRVLFEGGVAHRFEGGFSFSVHPNTDLELLDKGLQTSRFKVDSDVTREFLGDQLELGRLEYKFVDVTAIRNGLEVTLVPRSTSTLAIRRVDAMR